LVHALGIIETIADVNGQLLGLALSQLLFESFFDFNDIIIIRPSAFVTENILGELI
jgi:hypothetical protein